MTRPPRNIVASVRARLVQRSHELHVEHQLTLARFAGERLPYRLSATCTIFCDNGSPESSQITRGPFR